MFRVILADPPWSFDDRLTMSEVPRGAEANYPLLNAQGIADLPIADLALPDAILGLWCPASLIADGLAVMSGWGFDQKQVWEWIKLAKDAQFPADLAFGMGRIGRNCSELMLVGTRGSPYRFMQSHSERTVIVAPADLSLVAFHEATRHSVKPTQMHEAMERMFPDGPFLELFARRPQEGWTCWGHDITLRDIREDIADYLTNKAPNKEIPVSVDPSPIPRPIVTRVRSSVKGGVDAPISPRTLIVGDNADGKTAITQSIELAGSSAASDVQGRPLVRDAKQLQDLSAPAPLQAEVTLSHGGPLMYGPRGDRIAFPLRDVREALLGGADTMRAWVLRLAAASVSEDQVLAALRAADDANFDVLSARFLAIRRALPADASCVDAIRAARDNAQGKVSALRAEEVQSQGIVDFLARASATVTQEDLRAAEAAVVAASEVSVARLRIDADRAVSAFKTAKADLAVARGDAEARRQRVSDLVAQIPASWSDPRWQARSAWAHTLHGVAAGLRDRAEARGGCTGCVCGAENVEAAAFAETVRLTADVRDEAERAKIAQAALDQARKDLQSADLRVAEIEGRIGALRVQAEAALDALDAAQGKPDPIAASQELARVRNALSDAAKIAEARAKLGAVQQDLDLWQRTVRGLADAVEALVRQATTALEARVQRYLPPDDTFAIAITDTTCRMGLRADFGVRTALSGAEWTRMCLALAAVAVEGQSAETPVVLIPEERAWSANALETMMAALAAAPVQVVMTSTIEPKHCPEGWTILRMADLQPPAAQPEVTGRKPRKPRRAKATAADPAPVASTPEVTRLPSGLEVMIGADLSFAAERVPLEGE